MLSQKLHTLVLLLVASVHISSCCSPEANEALRVHNEYRNKHRVPPLELDERLCDRARNWAQTLAERDSGLEHSTIQFGLSENVFAGTGLPGQPYQPRDVVNLWYSEVRNYNYDNPDDQETTAVTGHFANVVWKSTNRFGFAMAQSASGQVYAVGQYVPGYGGSKEDWINNIPRPVA